jgi:uncharacterized protein YjbJ (UPF0337 family)
LLQALVHHGILKSNRGPRGGYELAREQRRITADDILRAAGTAAETECTPFAGSALLNTVVMPAVAQAEHAFSAALASVNVENLARSAAALQNSSGPHDGSPPWSEEWLYAKAATPGHQEHSPANGVFQQQPRNGVRSMDWNRLEGNWKQVKGKVKEKWGQLTDDDLDAINGRRDQLEGKIQERYGLAKDQVRKDVDDWYTAQRW